MIKYIAKPDTWFKEGTECELIDDCGEVGCIMAGIHIIDTENEAQCRNIPIGTEILDEELCMWDEFEVVDDEA